jgi:HEAT repeat protein
VALDGHTGPGDVAADARHDPDPSVRATALGALRRLGRLTAADLLEAIGDADAGVRARAAELAPGLGDLELVRAVVGLLADSDPVVVEAACFALGELGGPEGGPAGGLAAPGGAVGALVHVVADHRDPLCREAAVAALGALSDPAGLPAILAALGDKPAVRRRAVLALAPFEGPEVDDALERALQDRDWQVRQAAEDLTGRGESPTS